MTKSLMRRLRVFMVIVVFVTLLLTARLAWLQIHQYDYYAAKAENNRLRDLPITATRGEMKDANGELLATSRPGFAVSLLDLDRKKASDVIQSLSVILDMDVEEIQTKIAQQQFKSFAPIRIANDISHEVKAQIEERLMDLPGVIIEKQPVREYPFETLAAHALGYVGTIQEKQYLELKNEGYGISAIIGQFGLEKTWEPYLRGQDGIERVETNHYNQRVRVIDKTDPIEGNDLYLTLDVKLQRIAEKAVADVILKLQEAENEYAGKGAVVALDPKTGGILAMVSYPPYNPNTFYKDYEELARDLNNPLTNKAIRGAYPVGSTFKMVVATAGLEEGFITPDTIITCPGKKVFFPGLPPQGCYNNNAHGAVNVTRALQVSCNTFFMELAKRMGIDIVTEYAKEYGFTHPTGLTDLSGERAGSLLQREQGKTWYPGLVLNAAIGQGHEITPLQLANYGAMLANGGIHYRPHFVKEVLSPEGDVLYRMEPEVLNTLSFSDKTWQTIRDGMKRVTELGGTGGMFRDLPVKVAGKTGSAEAGPKGSHSLFLGYAPVDDPEVVLAVIMEHSGLGSDGGVPVAYQIFSEYYSTDEPVEEATESIDASEVQD